MTTPVPEAARPTRAQPELPGDFVGWLRSLVSRDDRASLAALRRGAGEQPGSVAEMFPLVEPQLPESTGDRQAQAAYRIAALFALHHQGASHLHDWTPRPDGRWEERNLGASLRMAARGDDGALDTGVERRFLALLDTPGEDLDHHLRGLFTLMKARNEDTPVDYRQLYHDLLGWDGPDRRVQREWAQGFWRGTGAKAPDDDNDSSAANGDDEEGN